MELLRKAVRGVIKADSRLYKSGAKTVDFLSTAWSDGYETWRILQRLKTNKNNQDFPHPVSLKSLRYPFYIRPGTHDVSIVLNNIIRAEYGQISADIQPRWMIDAGGYIGDTSAYFLSRFPQLKAICLEPNPESYRMAKLNLKPYGDRAIAIEKGLFADEEDQYYSGEQVGGGIQGFGGDSADIKIECTTIAALMDVYSMPRIDILKMDIEGAEKAVFSSGIENWLPKTSIIIIEFHGDAEAKILPILHAHTFKTVPYRSIYYCYNQRILGSQF